MADNSPRRRPHDGALRSLPGIAAHASGEVLRRIFDILGSADVAEVVAHEPNLRKEAIRSLEVSEMPADWHAEAGNFMEYLWTGSQDQLDREAVVLLAHRLRAAKAVNA